MATVVEGDTKAPFSLATTLSCRCECYVFPWIAPLLLFILNTYIIMLRHQVPFLSLWYDLTYDWTPVFRAIGEHFTH